MFPFMLLLEIAGVILGFAIAAELIAKGTEELEPMIGQGMAGGVVLGLIGALPETLFVVIATLHHSYDIALGSALGGNIILFTLGIGFVGIVYSLKWKKPILMKEDYKVEVRFLLFSTIILVGLLFYGTLNLASGTALLLIYLGYVAYRYMTSHAMIKKNASTPHGRRAMLIGLGFLALGSIIAFALSGFFVGLIAKTSSLIGFSALWVALVISPLAADMDEYMSGYRLATRSMGGGSTAIVSYMGAKLQNNTMLIGLIGILGAVPTSLASTHIEFLVVIGINIVAMAVILRGKITYRESVFLIFAYVAAIIATFIL